jgi:phage gpG-like protein
MTQFGLSMKVTKFFFDRKSVQDQVGKKNAKALAKAGAFVRRRARSSLRRRKRVSSPGSAPSVHSQDKVATLRNILFAYDRQAQSVVIGPVRLNGSQGSVPALHEFGGRAIIRRNRNRRERARQQPAVRMASYPARPFMGPALKAEAPKFPSLWVGNSAGAA